ncbi:hypothetical protein PGTUg99_033893 [Puccinia graminis f. sp. tritici]|uniref:Uncharacterized protein n=2 Tax=Puccinia graminis f. sp. tritici TaxID=56615 RepID=E3KAY3_PUCGT|nr:uncharacterized protein PGTG_06838 [Puccinia graminis f. sp. tritici CRL 75-36-700-3]EFP81217.1 hypothetical protein PGTG_06838 [Puccinia graminis f. sp. tritici CRL 75-36-700-3]KAA1139018.1 hypothetical protein PGTUg99_033893 [Puccinia graminis f. sp. tritici]
MLVKICWIVCFLLASVAALHPKVVSASDQNDCLQSTAKTTEPGARKQHFNRGISNGSGFLFASQKTNFKNRGSKSAGMRNRIMKDLAVLKMKFSDKDEVSVRWTIDVNTPDVPTASATRKIKVQLPLKIIFMKSNQLVS